MVIRFLPRHPCLTVNIRAIARDQKPRATCGRRRRDHNGGDERGNATMGLTATLAARIAATGYEELSAEALAAGRRLVLDGLAVAVAGTKEEAIGILAAHTRALGGVPEASAIGCGFRTDPVRAAALNGAAMHVLDFEPMWSPATHALSTTLPVALALGEACGLAGREVLTALVKGIEIQGWLREASGQFVPEQLQFHPPGLVGPMGAAVAAGHLLGLDGPKLQHALGIAASRAGSVFSNAGTMTKSTHCGQAAALGLDAAMLAARGFTGDAETFESPQGYGGTFYKGTYRPDELLKFGPPWRVVSPGFAIKMFPSQFGTHFVITAGLELHRRIADPAAIRAVTLVGPVMPYVNRPMPETGLSGKFSFQYVLAAALLDGKVGIGTFTDATLHRPDLQALLPRITFRMDKDIPARFETMHVEATAELADGRTMSARCDGPRGVWGKPPIPQAEHLAKVRDCLSVRLTQDSVERCITLAGSLDSQTPDGVRKLMALVRGQS
jgi:aconitate decarboxylase